MFGRSRYDYLVNMCDEMGIVTPEHPFPVWTEEGGPATIVPMFLLYDYTFLPAGAATKAEGLAIAKERNVVATDEFLMSSEPYATNDAWCRDRLAHTRKRLDDLDWMMPTVLVNHFPMVREPCDVLFYPEFSLWCGTTATEDWHTRYNAICSVYGHLHIPRTTWYDGVRFEEVSVGYPREWRRRKPYRWMRQVLPDPQYAPGYLNDFGGHFVITPEMRAQSEQFRDRLRSRGGHEQAHRPAATGHRRSGAEIYTDLPGLSALPEEEPLIAKSVAKRRNEFITVRHCARLALAETRGPAGADPQGRQGRTVLARRCGRQPDPLRGLSGRGRRPQRERVRSVGIDAEPHDVLPEGCSTRSACRPNAVRMTCAARRSALGPDSVLRQGSNVQGVVPADTALAGVRGRPHHLRRRPVR